MKRVLLISSDSRISAMLENEGLSVETAVSYEAARALLERRVFLCLICHSQIPIAEKQTGEIDALQFGRFLCFTYPWTRLIVLRDGMLDAYSERLNQAIVLPPPENREHYRRLSETVLARCTETPHELFSPVEEILLRERDGAFQGHGCEEQELREDLIDFLELKAQNFSSILDCGPALEVCWSGDRGVNFVLRGKRALLSIQGTSPQRWSAELKSSIQDRFGKTLF